MVNCKNCKHMCERDNGSIFCGVTLPPWLAKFVNVYELPGDAFDVTGQDGCDLGKEDK